MSISINTNLSSLFINNTLTKHSNAISTLFERLSTGCRINHAKDDAAGCAISTSLSNKISSYEIIGNNIQTAQSMVSTAEGAYGNILDMLTRIRDLSLQAINGTYSLEERQVLQDEAHNLVEEIYRVKSTTTFLNKKILGEEAFTTVEEGKAYNAKLEYEEKVRQAEEAQKAREADLINNQHYTAVYTAQQLHDALELNNPDCKVVLCADIDLADFEWIAVGRYSDSAFKGTFDGNGHTISNLTINKPTTDRQGLFGMTDGATISNVNLENVNIKGKGHTAALVGFSDNHSTITNCTVSGTVEGAGERVGGLVGDNHIYSTISNCNSSCNVTGVSYTGGLVGYNFDHSEIHNSNVSGTVTATGERIGGLVGNNHTNAVIDHCYSSANVIGTGDRIGGLVGLNNLSSEISDSSSTGNITTGGGSFTGGLVGYSNGSTVKNSTTNSKITKQAGANNVGAFAGVIDGTISGNEYNPTINEGMNIVGYGSVAEEQVKANSSLVIEKPKSAEPVPEYDKEYKDAKASLQVGIDSSNSSVIDVDTGVELGFLDVDLTTSESARKAIDDVDIMIDKVTSKQSELGAISNRLDSAREYQETSKLYLKMTNSVIKDTDFAQETSNFVRHQILQQVSTSLLTTANQTPSIALRLLNLG